MIKSLKVKGIQDPRGSKEKIQELAKSHNIPLQYDEVVVKEGWVGKAKGALQVLFERGWIDPDNICKYTGKGVKHTDVLCTKLDDNPYSINALMQKQDDFWSEMTLLQYHASKLGVALERSPKCHPEIAGEGIEYGWALSKMNYQRSPMSEKNNKESFRKLVKKCTDNKSVLNIKRMRCCSR